MPEKKDDPSLLDQLNRYKLRFSGLFEETNDAVFLMTLEGAHFEMNQNAADMLGYKKEELLKLSFRDIVVDEEMNSATSKLDSLLQGEKLPLYVRTFRKKDGSQIQVELDVAVIRDEHGVPQYIQSIARDISQRMELRASLEKSEEKYRLLANYAKDIIATLDMNLDFTYVSPSVQDVFGYKEDELLSRSITEILDEESLIIVEQAMSSALELEKSAGKDGYDAPPLELKVYHKDGSLKWAEVSRVFLRDDFDVPTGLLIVVREISRRKNTEAALQRSEKRYRELIELSPEGIGIVDLDENIIFSNAAFAEMLGYTVKELQGMTVLDIVAPSEIPMIREQTSMRATGKTSAYRVRLLRKDGSSRIARISAVPRSDEGKISSSIAVIVDITDAVRAEEDIAATNVDLELYASLLRHDLRNDLQVIITSAESAGDLMPTNELAIGLCETTKTTAERMNQLLDTFSIPTANLANNVSDLLEPIIAMAKKSYPRMKLELHSGCDLAKMEIARGRLLPVLFENLIRNSFQHAGPTAQVDITVSKPKDTVIIVFSDDGPGINPSVKDRLFQRGASTAGSGQGLYLCRKIAQAYGGSIELIEADVGTTFRVSLRSK